MNLVIVDRVFSVLFGALILMMLYQGITTLSDPHEDIRGIGVLFLITALFPVIPFSYTVRAWWKKA